MAREIAKGVILPEDLTFFAGRFCISHRRLVPRRSHRNGSRRSREPPGASRGSAAETVAEARRQFGEQEDKLPASDSVRDWRP